MELMSLNAVKLQGSTPTLAKKVEDITVKSTPKDTTSQNSVNEANSHNKYDTLELSDDYLEFKTKSENTAVKSDTNLANSTIPKELSGKPSQEGTGSAVMAETTQAAPPQTTSETEEEAVDDLSSYSAAELKTLVQEGKITTAEYNSEIESREDDTDTTTKQASTANSK
ncbi:hypothetical protein [Acetobacterium bakii]|uniref:Uncharacterized protein n=1 Tax=Acetobacterium bakii TaxID=52689 RepID=A0A0L6TXZ2_9FIRM|nr:hypothetical protein [Acetobacterium bakii]KNZ40937.1 hypothetical protein AKG39_14605 [Acetobacterium bakii]